MFNVAAGAEGFYFFGKLNPNVIVVITFTPETPNVLNRFQLPLRRLFFIYYIFFWGPHFVSMQPPYIIHEACINWGGGVMEVLNDHKAVFVDD